MPAEVRISVYQSSQITSPAAKLLFKPVQNDVRAFFRDLEQGRDIMGAKIPENEKRDNPKKMTERVWAAALILALIQAFTAGTPQCCQG